MPAKNTFENTIIALKKFLKTEYFKNVGGG